jgi:hypothetical protein
MVSERILLSTRKLFSVFKSRGIELESPQTHAFMEK